MMMISQPFERSGEGRGNAFRDFQVPGTPGSPPITPWPLMHSTASLVAERSGIRCLLPCDIDEKGGLHSRRYQAEQLPLFSSS